MHSTPPQNQLMHQPYPNQNAANHFHQNQSSISSTQITPHQQLSACQQRYANAFQPGPSMASFGGTPTAGSFTASYNSEGKKRKRQPETEKMMVSFQLGYTNSQSSKTFPLAVGVIDVSGFALHPNTTLEEVLMHGIDMLFGPIDYENHFLDKEYVAQQISQGKILLGTKAGIIIPPGVAQQQTLKDFFQNRSLTGPNTHRVLRCSLELPPSVVIPTQKVLFF
jgi:hypothetical protein